MPFGLRTAQQDGRYWQLLLSGRPIDPKIYGRFLNDYVIKMWLSPDLFAPTKGKKQTATTDYDAAPTK